MSDAPSSKVREHELAKFDEKRRAVALLNPMYVVCAIDTTASIGWGKWKAPVITATTAVLPLRVKPPTSGAEKWN